MIAAAPKYPDSLTGVRCRVNRTFLELFIEQDLDEECHEMIASKFDVSKGRPRARSVDSSTSMRSSQAASLDGSWPLRPLFQHGGASDARSDSQESDWNESKTPSLCCPLDVNMETMSTEPPSPRDHSNAWSDSTEEQKEKPQKKRRNRKPKGTRALQPVLVPGEITAPQPTTYADKVVGDEGITTVMIRNIACRYTKEEVVEILNSVGLKGTFNFVYLPLNDYRRANRGYAFVSFDSVESVQRCEAALVGRVFGYRNSSKICEVSASRIQECDEVMQVRQNDRHYRKCWWMAGDDAQARAAAQSEV